MNNKLICPFCPLEKESSLVILDASHPEFHMCMKISDGTKKWYCCKECGGVYCRDKIKSSWQYSPSTYSKFVEGKLIADRLEN